MLNMLFTLLISSSLLSLVTCNGDLVILHHPKSLIFKGHDHVKESILKEIYSTALGFTTEQYSNFDGLYIEDPFNLAEAVVTVAIDGVSDIGNTKGHHFPLKTNDEESTIFSALEQRVLQRYPESESNLVRIDLEDGLLEVNKYRIFKNVKNDKAKKSNLNQLKLSVDEDRAFLNDIALLNSIIEAVEQGAITPDNIPDIYWFRIASIHALRDLYGENSTQIKEAKQILTDTILHLNAVFNKIYKGKVLVNVISSDAVHTRRARNILAAKADTDDVKPAKPYSKNYPVIFNIILWFGVTMFFTLLAICIATATMDPGRDSIIYRMTSTRLKKD